MYIGIRSTFEDFDLRRDLLLFDKLAIPTLEDTLRVWATSQKEELRRQAAELEWLANQDIVFVPAIHVIGTGPEADFYHDYVRKKEQVASEITRVEPFMKGMPPSDGNISDVTTLLLSYLLRTGDHSFLERLDQATRECYDALSRVLAISLGRKPGAIPMLVSSTPTHIAVSDALDRTDVLSISWQAIPFPAQDTPLEKLLDFRSDQNIRMDFLELHRWASDTAAVATSPQEVLERAEYLIHQYKKHLQIFGMEQDAGTIETLVTTLADAVENLLKVNLGDMTRLLFSFRKRRVALLKEEMKAPGHELAYIVKARAIGP